jgi:aryl-alcohol dehydrogenase-like predicted oxidoreductase
LGQYKFDPEGDQEDGKQIPWVSIYDQLTTLSKLIDSGKIRTIALSNEQPWGLMEFIRVARQHKLPIISALQNSYSLLNRTAEFGITEILYREQLSFLAYSPLAFGYLTGKYIEDEKAAWQGQSFSRLCKKI